MKPQISTNNQLIEKKIPVGTWGDKYSSSNPIVKQLMYGFKGALFETLSDLNNISSVHEVGCGEGVLANDLSNIFVDANITASDFSQEIIKVAKMNYPKGNIKFIVKDIYDMTKRDKADLVVAAEVLEHLHDPETAMYKLYNISNKYLLISVPNEPLFRLTRLVGGKNITAFGNAPGHLNHWNIKGIRKLVSKRFKILELHTPYPWIMILAEKLL